MEISKEYIGLLVSIITIIFQLANVQVLPEQIQAFAFVLFQLITAVFALLKIKTMDNTNWLGGIKK